MTVRQSNRATDHEVVIVGNGSLGLALGLVLARRGVRVAVLGQPHRAGSASTAAGAMIGTFGEITSTLLSSHQGRTKLDWAYRAARLWPEWLAGLAPHAGPTAPDDGSDLLTADGTVVMLNTVGMPGIDTENYRAIRQTLVDYGEKFEDIEPGEIAWLDPDPAHRPLKALFIPGEHAVDVRRLLARTEAAFVGAGGTLLPDEAAHLAMDGERVTAVELRSGGSVRARHVVLAAGAMTQALLDTVPDVAAGIPPLVSGYGISVLADLTDDKGPRCVLRTPNRAFACGLHVVPRGGGKVYLGATNVVSARPRTTAQISDVLFLLNCAQRQVNRSLAESGVHSLQVGNRPVALDGMPLLGPAGPDGLWIMTGTYRDGLTLSPLLATAMSASILGEQPTLELELFTPVRAPIQVAPRNVIVEMTVEHMLATGVESAWQMPVDWLFTMQDHLRAAYTRLADDLDPDYTPPPELLSSSRIIPELASRLRSYYSATRAPAGV